MTFALTGVTYRYPGSARDAFPPLSADFPAGSATAVLGPNGAGKSTLLGLLGLLCDGGPTAGTLAYTPPGGTPVPFDHTLPPAARAALRGRQFGFVLQSARLLSSLTSLQNLELPLVLAGDGRAARDERVRQLVAAAYQSPADFFDHVAGRFPHQLSGGQRQLVTVLRALAHRPRVLFADEPANHLDPPATDRVAGLIGGWRRGELSGDDTRPRTLVLVTHDVPFACRLADRFLLLGWHAAEPYEPRGPAHPDDVRARLDRVCRTPREGGG